MPGYVHLIYGANYFPDELIGKFLKVIGRLSDDEEFSVGRTVLLMN